MGMLSTDGASTINPAAHNKKRFGVIFARIGRQFCHTLGIAISLDEPLHSTQTHMIGGTKARTRINAASSHFEYAMRNGAPYPVKALPGAQIYLEMQDYSRLTPEEQTAVRWTCTHPSCGGGTLRVESKDDLVRRHGKQRDLVAEAEKSPNGMAHLCYGVIESASEPGKKDEKGRPIAQATPAIVMLVSDEE